MLYNTDGTTVESWNFEIWIFENWIFEIWNFEISNFEVWNFYICFIWNLSFNYSKSRRKHLTGVYFVASNNYMNLNIDVTSWNRRRRYQYWAPNGLSVMLLLRRSLHVHVVHDHNLVPAALIRAESAVATGRWQRCTWAAHGGPAESSSHASTFTNSRRVHPGLSEEL